MRGSEKLEALMEADPAAALKLLQSLEKQTVVPHAGGQKEIMDDDTRFKVICCGRRFGKTVIGAKKALVRARKPNQMVWWVAPTYKVVKRGYREVLRQLPKDMLTHVPPQDSAFDAGRSVILKFKNGSRMEFYSAERPEGMLGEGVDLAILDEAAIMGKNVWDQIVRPTLMDRQGQALMISTPRGRNWFYYLWLKGQNRDNPNYASWRFPTSANPYIPADEIEDMRENMPLVVFQQEVLAEFISSAGAVFRFDAKIVVKRVAPKGHVVVGIDLAKTNDFTVISAARSEDMLPCGFERFNEVAWGVQKNRIRKFVARLKAAGASGVTLVMDSTGVGDPIVEEIEENGYDVVPINFTKTKQHMVVQLGKDLEDGYVRLDSAEDISEFENYSYKVTEAGRWTYSAPEGQHDDCVSAKMLQHWGITQEGVPNIVAMAAADPVSVAEAIDPEPENDWSDLLEDEEAAIVDTGIPEVLELVPDAVSEIMLRATAWNAREMV
jgi:phage FluMu gp28-like protein